MRASECVVAQVDVLVVPVEEEPVHTLQLVFPESVAVPVVPGAL